MKKLWAAGFLGCSVGSVITLLGCAAYDGNGSALALLIIVGSLGIAATLVVAFAVLVD